MKPAQEYQLATFADSEKISMDFALNNANLTNTELTLIAQIALLLMLIAKLALMQTLALYVKMTKDNNNILTD